MIVDSSIKINDSSSNQEYKISDTYLRNVKTIRNIFAAFFPVSIVAIYLSINTHLSSLTLMMGSMSFGLFVIAGFIERYRKSCQTKKVMHSTEGITVFTQSENDYLAWESISAAYHISFPPGIILKDNNNQVLIEEHLSEPRKQMSEMLSYLKLGNKLSLVNLIQCRPTRIIEVWLLGFWFFICGVLTLAPDGPYYNEILVFSSFIIIVHSCYWAWPKLKKIELTDNKLKFSTQYGVKLTHDMNQVATISFLSSLVMDNLRMECLISLKNDKSFAFSMNGWNYMQVLSLFRDYDLKFINK